MGEEVARGIGEHVWLRNETWPIPGWYDEDQKDDRLKDYEAFFTHQLRTRYTELEGDFRSVFGNFSGTKIIDMPTAERIVDYLHAARKALEKKNPDLLAVSSILDLVERYMVWLYPPHVARARIISIRSRLDTLNVSWKASIIKELDRLSAEDIATDRAAFGQLRATFDEVIGASNKQAIDEQISNGLQIERLKMLIRWGLVFLASFLAISPLLMNSDAVNRWPTSLIPRLPIVGVDWLAALAISGVGAVGGFLSGLLQVRSSRVNLSEYQESSLKLELKPLVGAIVSLVLYILLSWQILPGIRIENTGSYILLAFLSGFSERYFLKLLELKTQDEQPIETPGTSRSMTKIPGPELIGMPTTENPKQTHDAKRSH